MPKVRTVVAYGNYFEDFLLVQPEKVQNKIFKIIEATETLERAPANYLKTIEGSRDYTKQEFNLDRTFGAFSAFSIRIHWSSCLTDFKRKAKKHQPTN